MSAADVTPDELLGLANAAVRATGCDPVGYRDWLQHGEIFIGEIAVSPGELLALTSYAGGRLLRLRVWRQTPEGGGRLPTRFGVNISVSVLPQFAGLIATALERQLRPTLSRREGGGRTHAAATEPNKGDEQ